MGRLLLAKWHGGSCARRAPPKRYMSDLLGASPAASVIAPLGDVTVDKPRAVELADRATS